jgi:hypothetical protein
MAAFLGLRLFQLRSAFFLRPLLRVLAQRFLEMFFVFVAAEYADGFDEAIKLGLAALER